MFKLIKFDIQIYPHKKKKEKKRKNNFKFLKILYEEKDKLFDKVFGLIKKIKIIELYSQICFGNTNPYITVYVTTLINGIYGNIINIFNCDKLYLNVAPNFTENNIKGSVKLHIKFRLIIMFKLIPILIRIIVKKYRTKEGDVNDCN